MFFQFYSLSRRLSESRVVLDEPDDFVVNAFRAFLSVLDGHLIDGCTYPFGNGGGRLSVVFLHKILL
jgi:hypothetical protein